MTVESPRVAVRMTPTAAVYHILHGERGESYSFDSRRSHSESSWFLVVIFAIFTQSGNIFRHFSMVPSTYILDSDL